MESFSIKTLKRNEIVDITDKVNGIVEKSKIKEGICLVFVPHATAALTINENADPNVCSDFLDALNKLFPKGSWKHDRIDGNGDAHVKSAVVGPEVTIPIENSKLVLGTWQGIMFCEFDGPRTRTVHMVCK
jgi:secondary thiamine-phosphate synthase enzyme